MSEIRDRLESMALFAGLLPQELDIVAGLVGMREHAEGDVIQCEGEPGDEMFIIDEGVVELTKTISEDVTKTLQTAQAGGVFGVLAVFDENEHPVTATAVEPTRVLVIARADLCRLCEEEPKVGTKLFFRLAKGLSSALRLAIEQLRNNIEWTMSVGGAVGLNLQRLIGDRVDVTLALMGGREVKGNLLKVDESMAGHELWIQTAGGEVAVIPYHAVTMLTFDEGEILSATDVLEE